MHWDVQFPSKVNTFGSGEPDMPQEFRIYPMHFIPLPSTEESSVLEGAAKYLAVRDIPMSATADSNTRYGPTSGTPQMPDVQASLDTSYVYLEPGMAEFLTDGKAAPLIDGSLLGR